MGLPSGSVTESGDWVTVHEVARVLRLTSQTVARFVRRGDLPADDPRARSPRIRRCDLDAFIEASRIQPGTLDFAGPVRRHYR